MTEKELTVDVERFIDHYYHTGWCDQKGGFFVLAESQAALFY